MKNVKSVLVKAPALSMTGYGEQSRFLLKALRNREDVDIFLNNTTWGASNNVANYEEQTNWIKSLIAKTSKKYREEPEFTPDMSIQVTVPNQWENLAPINVGYTAGIETDRVTPAWIESANHMDKVVTISKHSMDVFKNTHYDVVNTEDESVVSELKLETDIEFVNYGIRTSAKDKKFKLNLPTKYNFLAVAQLGPRKNIISLINSFVEEFHDEEVGLVVKGFVKNNTIKDKTISTSFIRQITNNHPDRKCKVYLLHGELSSSEMSSLYQSTSIKSFVTTTHGEGFGLPIFEAASYGLPVVSPNWSGQKDFLDISKSKLFCEIPHTIAPVSQHSVWENVIEKEAQWAHVTKEDVKSCLRDVYKNQPKYKRKASSLKKKIVEKFNEKQKLTELANSVLSPLKNKGENKNEII